LLTIITPATTFALAEAATIIEELGDDTIDPDFISRLIDGASKRIATYCNRVFARETVAETFRLDCRQECLLLARVPVVSFTSVVENGVTLTGADYEVDAATGVLSRLIDDVDTLWASGKIVVTYAAGFLLPGEANRNLPDDIERACIELVKRAYYASSQDPMVKADEVDGIGRQEFFAPSSKGLPAEVEAILSDYRAPAL
jgi:hypothetical protein